MSRFLFCVLGSAMCLGVGAGLAWAEDEAEPTGELHVTMNSDYVTVKVNGGEWSAVEFAKQGKKALIKHLKFDEEPITVELVPSYDELAPVTLELKRKDFKRRRLKGGYFLVASRRVKFTKKTTPVPTPSKPAPEEPKKPTTPEPSPGDEL